ncbi:alpha/beta fold hydrolase [Rudanella paleaurantiibacter]|uniref:Alpha/beta fold hydrolase n=1 Tax=Rudanella paleaurantiibacter TaxID=2614655 RepID=A0A7J5TZC6_9BACT|nr:alpha/beta hydrolase [Rudanella paleaurantiibacter]KAB7730317.1 alpha/beta fold hydrolase [Rudanella paleaurantiibacter]
MNQKKTVVLLHGHGVDSSIWDTLYTELAQDYQLVKPDFSGLANHTTIEAYAEYLYSMLQAAQIDQAVLVGHSMGGYVALAFAEYHPDLVSGLVLFHSTVFADDEERKAKRQAAIEQIQQQGSRAFVEETVPKMVAPAHREKRHELVANRIEIGAQLPPDALAAGVRAIAARPDRSAVLQRATFPVLVIAGKEDNLVPFEKSIQMADLLNEKGVFVGLENARHLGMIEQPEESLRILREFLVRV